MMEVLEERNGTDTELLVFAMTLINKVNKISKCEKVRSSEVQTRSSVCFSDSDGAPGPGLVLRCDGQAGAAGDGGRHPQTHEQQGDGVRPADAVRHIRGDDEKQGFKSIYMFEEHMLPPNGRLLQRHSCPAVAPSRLYLHFAQHPNIEC